MLVTLDADLQEDPLEKTEEARLRIPKLTRRAHPQGDDESLREAAKMLVAAENPVIYTNRYARTENGPALLVELAELLGAPVVDAHNRMNMANRHPLNHSSRREARLVRSGETGLRRVFATHAVSIYAVPRPEPIVTGPDRPAVLAIRESRLVLRVAQGGTYRVAVRWSPYWHASTGCLTHSDGGMLQLRTRAAATVRIRFDVDAGSLFHAFADTRPRCPAGTG